MVFALEVENWREKGYAGLCVVVKMTVWSCFVLGCMGSGANGSGFGRLCRAVAELLGEGKARGMSGGGMGSARRPTKSRRWQEEVAKGNFREDLWYRLNVFTIKVPPLRERTGDICILANHFVGKYSEKIDKPMKGLSQEALHCLESYSFPGNVRELENEIERALALAQDAGVIGVSHLSEKIVNKCSVPGPDLEAQGTLKQMVEALEKSVLIRLLEKHDGNKTRVAKELGLSRYGLMKKMQRYGF